MLKKTSEFMRKTYPHLFEVYETEFIPEVIKKIRSKEFFLSTIEREHTLDSAIQDIEIHYPSTNTTEIKKALPIVGSLSVLDVKEIKEALTNHALNIKFTQQNGVQYLLFANSDDAKKFEELREAGNLFKPSALIDKNLLTNAKAIGSILPTNLDNLVIAGAVGLVTAGVSYSGDADAKAAINDGIKNAEEASGFSSFGRSINAGRNGEIIESAKQFLDGWGIPIPALEEAIKKSWQECSPRDFKAHCLPASQKPKNNEL